MSPIVGLMDHPPAYKGKEREIWRENLNGNQRHERGKLTRKATEVWTQKDSKSLKQWG